MNEEDAIRCIEDFGLYHAIEDLPHSIRTVEAFEMAIKALKKQERNEGKLTDDDLISRQALCEYALNQKDKSVTPNDIMRFPSAEPETCKYWDGESNFCALHRPSAQLEWHDCDPTDKSTLPKPGSWAIWSDKEGHRIIARWKEDAIDHFFPDQRMFDFNLEDAVAWMEIPERRWIPVTERLPEEEGDYLITDDSGGIKTIEVDSFMFFEDGTKDWCYSQNAIAWMPLPKPYSERRQE